MRIEITEHPNQDERNLIVAQVRAFNATFVERDVRCLCVFARDTDGSIIGGVSADTYWDYLHISHLWVHEQHRRKGIDRSLMLAAESEARIRGCRNALVDTLSFQAPGFYIRMGYEEFGRLPGFSGKHERHFMHKRLIDEGA